MLGSPSFCVETNSKILYHREREIGKKNLLFFEKKIVF